MNNFVGNIGHIVTSLAIIVVVTVLAYHGTITGSEALTIIGVLGGVSVGGSVASSSVGVPAPGSVVAPTSNGTAGSVVTVTTTATPAAPASTSSTPDVTSLP